MERILVTGASGFIGFHTTRRLLSLGFDVVGIDDMNPYYDVKLKEDRLNILKSNDLFTFHRFGIENQHRLAEVFAEGNFDCVVHLAGQAGVRAPASEAYRYVTSNLVGFANMLDFCQAHRIKHLVYASSSSVYGHEARAPFSTNHAVDHPQSLYAATKRANEILAHSYSHQYDLPTTGLRFFTVYGPWGRPDMAVYSFAQSIMEGSLIELYGEGELERDFTYIDDVVDVILGILECPPQHGLNGQIGPGTSQSPFQILNVGSGFPTKVKDLVNLLEDALGEVAEVHLVSRPSQDMRITHAEIEQMIEVIGIRPKTSLQQGIKQFTEWFKKYHNFND